MKSQDIRDVGYMARAYVDARQLTLKAMMSSLPPQKARNSRDKQTAILLRARISELVLLAAELKWTETEVLGEPRTRELPFGDDADIVVRTQDVSLDAATHDREIDCTHPTSFYVGNLTRQCDLCGERFTA